MKRKRNYPAWRATKSMKKSAVPCVQGFDLKRNMAELEQRPEKGDELHCTGPKVEAEQPDETNFSPERTRGDVIMSPKTHQTASEREEIVANTINAPEFSFTVDNSRVFMFDTLWWRGWLRIFCIDQMTGAVEDYLINRLKKCIRPDIFTRMVFSETLLIREQHLDECYGLNQLAGIHEKHRDFVTYCGRLLHCAQTMLQDGDPTFLDYLVENDVPRKMWEVGWQKFLDHLDVTGQHKQLEVYLQEAYNEIYSLKNDIPILEDHWQECLKGLDKYSQKLRQPIRGWVKGLPSTTGDPGGGNDDTVDLAKHWHIPLSAIARTVLKGWSIVGRLVRAAVYVSVGCVFCQIDRW